MGSGAEVCNWTPRRSTPKPSVQWIFPVTQNIHCATFISPCGQENILNIRLLFMETEGSNTTDLQKQSLDALYARMMLLTTLLH